MVKSTFSLERVAYAEIDTDGIEERGDVEIGVDGTAVVGFVVLRIAVGLVRRMDRHTEIETNHESFKIQTQTETRTEGYLLGKILIVEDAVQQFATQLELLHVVRYALLLQLFPLTVPRPYVAGIKEGSAVQFPHDGEAQLEIGFELDISGVEEVLVVLLGIEVTGTVGIR